MTIRYITNLTIDEQLSWWDSGNEEEYQLAKWLRQQLIDIEQDIAAIAEEFRQEGYEAGLRAAAEYQEADR